MVLGIKFLILQQNAILANKEQKNVNRIILDVQAMIMVAIKHGLKILLSSRQHHFFKIIIWFLPKLQLWTFMLNLESQVISTFCHQDMQIVIKLRVVNWFPPVFQFQHQHTIRYNIWFRARTYSHLVMPSPSMEYFKQVVKTNFRVLIT